MFIMMPILIPRPFSRQKQGKGLAHMYYYQAAICKLSFWVQEDVDEKNPPLWVQSCRLVMLSNSVVHSSSICVSTACCSFEGVLGFIWTAAKLGNLFFFLKHENCLTWATDTDTVSCMFGWRLFNTLSNVCGTVIDPNSDGLIPAGPRGVKEHC